MVWCTGASDSPRYGNAGSRRIERLFFGTAPGRSGKKSRHMSTLNIKVIVGSSRANRFSEKPAQWIFDLAKTRADMNVELVDLRDYPLPFFEEPLPPGFAKDNYTNPAVVKWREK